KLVLVLLISRTGHPYRKTCRLATTGRAMSQNLIRDRANPGASVATAAIGNRHMIGRCARDWGDAWRQKCLPSGKGEWRGAHRRWRDACEGEGFSVETKLRDSLRRNCKSGCVESSL